MHGHKILKLLDILCKNTEISDFTKIGAVGAEFFHADGLRYRLTEKTKLMLAFRNFSNEHFICTFVPPNKFVLWKRCIFLFRGKGFRYRLTDRLFCQILSVFFSFPKVVQGQNDQICHSHLSPHLHCSPFITFCHSYRRYINNSFTAVVNQSHFSEKDS
jgi:hypothetical protein